ncbi:MAG: hypothetical protein ABID64_04815, partial [Nitrospirota bacterium]
MKNRSTFLTIGSLIFLSALIYIGAFHTPPLARSATTRTVCAAGCDHTTITAAITASAIGDTIDVQATYAPAGDASPITVGEDVTIDCGDVATIGTTGTAEAINITVAGATISNCEFDRVNITISAGTVTIDSNAFDPNYSSDITITGGDNSTISDNTAINGILINGTIDGTEVSGNTIEIRSTTGEEGI